MSGELLKEKGFLLSVSLVSLALAAGMIFRSKRGRAGESAGDVVDLEVQEQEINRQLDSLSNLQAVLAEKAEEIELKYLKNAPHVLAAESLKEIFTFTPSIIDAEELQTIFANNRKARRSCFPQLKNQLGGGPSSELEVYYRFVCTFEEEVQYLVEKAQKDFVIFLNIDYSTITESVDFHMSLPETGFAEWVKKWMLSSREQLKEKLKLYEQPVTAALVLEIAKYQIQCLGQEADNFKQAVLDLQLETEEQHENVPTFLEVFLQDLVHLKYGVEIEQINIISQDLTEQLSDNLHVLSELKAKVLKSMQFQENELDHSVGSFEGSQEI